MALSPSFLSLAKYVLPEELLDFFELVQVEESLDTLHLHLSEHNLIPEEYSSLSLSPNGFYEASTIKDFPLRDKKVVLHL